MTYSCITLTHITSWNCCHQVTVVTEVNEEQQKGHHLKSETSWTPSPCWSWQASLQLTRNSTFSGNSGSLNKHTFSSASMTMFNDYPGVNGLSVTWSSSICQIWLLPLCLATSQHFANQAVGQANQRSKRCAWVFQVSTECVAKVHLTIGKLARSLNLCESFWE